MFRNNVVLRRLAKNYMNAAENIVCVASSSTYRRVVTPKAFSSDRTRFNGFHKPFNGQTEIGKNERTFSVVSSEKCWHCQKDLKVEKYTCASCGALQHPSPTVNYFDLLGISQAYELDVEDLSSKFKNLQKAFHPDKFVNKSKEEMEISEEYSRLINKAYTTLKDPSSRGFYLLRLQNVSVTPDAPMAPDFLLDIMEKNEELEKIEDKIALELFFTANKREVKKQRDIVSEAFRHKKWDDAKDNLLKLNYYMNLDKKIKEKQARFNLPEGS